MKNIRRLALMVSLCLLTVLSLGIVLFAASACQPAEQSETLDGTYYADVNGEEYTVAFSSGDSYAFTFSVAGDDRTGTYFYSGSAVTLTFSEEGETLSATLSGDVLSFTYKGTAYEMIPMVTYTVTFDLDGGTGTASAQVVNGRLLPKPADPQKDGNVFIGWYADSAFTEKFDFETQKITGNVTLYARFVEGPAAEEFTVSFETGSGYEGDPIADVQTIGHGIYNLPELPALDGKDFLGWWRSDYEDAAKLTAMVTDGYEVDENTTLFAVWESDAPAVSVTESGVSWTSVGVGAAYSLTITDSSENEVYSQPTVLALSESFDFTKEAAGDYIITVTASNNASATAFYRNKGLATVSLFEVKEGTSVLLFNAIENADYYKVSYFCGTSGHTHTEEIVDIPSYDFSECKMPKGGFTFVVQAFAEGYVASSPSSFNFERQLDAVTGLSVVDDGTKTVAVWNAVENADSYTVTITMGTEKNTITGITATEVDLQYLYGEFTIEVIPNALSYTSPAAVSLTENKGRLATPENIRVSGNTIVWDSVTDATGYILILGEEHIPLGDVTSYSPKDSELEGLGIRFIVSVQAIATAENNNSFVAQQTVSRILEAEDVSYENGNVVWNAVMGISKYGVKIGENGSEIIVEDTTSLAVALPQLGDNEIFVRYYAGEAASEWVSITVVTTVTVTFDGNSGPGARQQDYYYVVGDPIRLPADEWTRIGYTFDDWFTSAEGGSIVEEGDLVASADVTYFAHWTANKYLVTLSGGTDWYFAEEGNLDTLTVEVTYGQIASLPTPVSTSGIQGFTGWYTAANVQITDYTGTTIFAWNVASNIALNAHGVNAIEFRETNHPNTGEPAYTAFRADGMNYLAEVTIPAVYNGRPVVSIEGGCFTSSRLQTINIPDSILQIAIGLNYPAASGSAFYGASNVQTVNVYDASSYIEGNYTPVFWDVEGVLVYDSGNAGVRLFYYPHGRTDIEYTIPDGVEVIPRGVFYLGDIVSVKIPASVTYIEGLAFNTSRIEEIEFLPVAEGSTPELLTIDDGAFSMADITTITLPARLSDFNPNMFEMCDELATIYIEEVDIPGFTPEYMSGDDGMIYTYDGQTLVFCPRGREGSVEISALQVAASAFEDCEEISSVTISGRVQLIGEYAFAGCFGLNEIKFMGTGTDQELTIEAYAFYGCTNLKSIALPENLSYMGDYAFGGNTLLTSVTITTDRDFTTGTAGVFVDTNGTSSVTTVVIGPNVTDFDIAGVFGSSLERVEVDPNNINYKADEDGVLFNYAMTNLLFFPTGKVGDYTVPDTVTTIEKNVFANKTGMGIITIGAKVSSIGEGAFENCDFTGIVFLESETGADTLVIGERAFRGAVGMEILQLPARLMEIGNHAFFGCRNLSSVTFKEGVPLKIGHAAFGSCSGLKTVNLPACLTELAEYSQDFDYILSPTVDGQNNIDVFYNDSALATITIPAENAYYGVVDGVLYGKNEAGDYDTLYFTPRNNAGTDGTVNIPGTVAEIKNGAFYNNELVEEVRFEDRTTDAELTVGAFAFSNAKKLGEVYLPNGLTTIADSMFNNSSIGYIFIPNTVTYIGESAFYSCKNLTDVDFETGGSAELTIADGTRSEGGSSSGGPTNYYGVFGGCTSLMEIAFPERTVKIGAYAFAPVTDYSGININASPLQSVQLPSTLEVIGERAFNNAFDLEIIFPGSFTSSEGLTIGERAFYNLGTKVQSLELPEGVVSIGDEAFRASDLVSVSLPASLGTIGSNAFSGIQTLTSVTIANGSSLISIGQSAFMDAGLTSVNLEAASALEQIGELAFSGTGIASVKIPASVKSIGGNAFSDNELLTTVEFLEAEVSGGGGITASALSDIGDEAFANTALTFIEFPESTADGGIALGNELFASCWQLTRVYISASISSVGSAFARCMSIQEIEVAPENQNFQAVDGEPLLLTVERDGEGEQSGMVITAAFGAVSGNVEGEAGSYRIPDVVTAIGESAFRGQNNIRKLIIPAGVTDIGNYAFYYMRDMEEVFFEQGSALASVGDYAFSGCISLTTINLPEGLMRVGKRSFEGNVSIKELTLPSTLKTVGDYAFQYNTALEKVNIPAIVVPTQELIPVGENTRDWDAQNMFGNCVSLYDVTFAENITYLPASMFSGATSLKHIEIPDSVDALTTADAVFADSGLESIDLGGLTEIPESMFEKAANLKTIDFNGIKSIGKTAFKGANSLAAELDLSTVTSIGEDAFIDIPTIERVTLSGSLATLASGAFEGCVSLATVDVYNADAQTSTNNPVGVVTLPDSITTLGASVFMETAIREVTIPRSVTKLHTAAKTTSTSSPASSLFEACKQLEKVVLHDALEVIGASTFEGCSALKTIQYIDEGGELIGDEGKATLPDSVTLIGNNAFGSGRDSKTIEDWEESGKQAEGCAFTSVVVPASVTLMGKCAFQDCNELTYAEYRSAVTKLSTSATGYSTYVFSGCTSLERVALNASITFLGNYFFADCTSLATIDLYVPGEAGTAGSITESEEGVAALPAGLTYIGSNAFQKTAIREITIPTGVTKLSSAVSNVSSSCAVFEGCRYLETVILHNKLTMLGEEIFMNCPNLKTVRYIDVDAENALVGEAGTVTLPEGLTLLGTNAFTASGIERVIVPSTIENRTGNYAFRNCTELVYAEYRPEAIKSANSSYTTYLFDGCSALKTVVLNSAITYLPKYTFYNCTSLDTVLLYTAEDGVIGEPDSGTVTLPPELTTLAEQVFYNTAIKEITLPDTVTSVGDGALAGTIVTGSEDYIEAMDGVVVEVDGNTVISVSSDFAGEGGSYVVPEGVTIGAYALAQSTLSSVTVAVDQLDEYSMSGFKGNVIVTWEEGMTTVLPSYSFNGWLGTSVVLPDEITEIRNYAFEDAVNLESIELPANLQRIYGSAFAGCTSLTTVDMPSYSYTGTGNFFADCTALTTITLGENVTYLPNSFAKDLANLKNVSFPDGLTYIGSSAFENTGLASSVSIPSSVTEIGSYAFCGTAITEFILQEGLVEIGSMAFGGTQITAATIPSTVTTVGDAVFSGCTLLEKVFLPDSLTEAGDNLFAADKRTTSGPEFAACTSLKNVYTYTLNDEGEMGYDQLEEGVADISSMTDIAEYMFRGCTSITKVIFNEELATLGDYAFQASGLTEVEIPGSIGTLGTSVFADCASLKTATLGEGITKINAGAFSNCTSLEKVDLPSTITSLSGFQNCTALKEFVIPANVTNVINGTFTGWTSEQTITVEVYALDSISSWGNTWMDNSKAKIKVEVIDSYEETEAAA